MTGPSARPLEGILVRPPAILAPDRATFARELNAATRALSIAHAHETESSSAASYSRRYELAYPLYVAAAQGFLWACRNAHNVGIIEASLSAGEGSFGEGQGDRAGKLRDNFMRQAKKALERADKIKEVKGSEWARRWAVTASGPSSPLTNIDAQAKVLQQSSSIHGLMVPPWLPTEEPVQQASQPLPALSESQQNSGTYFERAADLETSAPDMVLLDAASPLRGSAITQDAVTNCGYVAALEVMAEHDFRWQSSLLTTPLARTIGRPDLRPSSAGRYAIGLHLNGCRRKIVIDDRLPVRGSPTTKGKDNESSRQIVCASVTHPGGRLVLLPALLEKAYLTVLRSYAPHGSVPAEDLHVLTGWLPEVCALPGSQSAPSANTVLFHKERLWHRILRGWKEGSLLICGGTSKNPPAPESSGDQTALTLVPGHTYSVLELSCVDDKRSLLLMNPWRSSPKTSQKSSLLTLSWDEFCAGFGSLHLAWNPATLFEHVCEVHTCWSPDESVDGAGPEARNGQSLRDVEILMTVSQTRDDRRGNREGSQEVWLHLTRHFPGDLPTLERTASKQYIALHVFEQHSTSGNSASFRETRVIPLGGDREGYSDYVDSAHHLVRFNPSFVVNRVLREDQIDSSRAAHSLEKQYKIVASLHDSDGESQQAVNFTLRAWSEHSLTFSEPVLAGVDGAAGKWSGNLKGSWSSPTTAGGSADSPSYHRNPQYLISVPPGTPLTNLHIALQTTPPVPCHIAVVHARSQVSKPHDSIRVDRVDRADIVADSGPYSQGLTRTVANLAPTGPTAPARYIVVVSTFEADQEASFTLSLSSKQKLTTSQRPLASTLCGNTGARPTSRGSEASNEPAIMIQPLLPEGAGLFAKTITGKWDLGRGNAAGAPRWGRYDANPKWLLYTHTDSSKGGSDAVRSVPSPHAVDYDKAVFRLTAVAATRDKPAGKSGELHESSELSDAASQDEASSSLSSPPAINLSLFSATIDSGSGQIRLDREIATTGPYTVSKCGVALHDVRLPHRLLAAGDGAAAESEGASRLVLVASTFDANIEADFTLNGWCGSRSWDWRPL
ncbi:unnamed protein product [Parajaminaea phylloscopi]